MRDLMSTGKKSAGGELSDILPKSSQARKKPPPAVLGASPLVDLYVSP